MSRKPLAIDRTPFSTDMDTVIDIGKWNLGPVQLQNEPEMLELFIFGLAPEMFDSSGLRIFLIENNIHVQLWVNSLHFRNLGTEAKRNLPWKKHGSLHKWMNHNKELLADIEIMIWHRGPPAPPPRDRDLPSQSLMGMTVTTSSLESRAWLATIGRALTIRVSLELELGQRYYGSERLGGSEQLA